MWRKGHLCASFASLDVIASSSASESEAILTDFLKKIAS